jgi:hypothetical protein
MKTALAGIILLLACLSAHGCYAQSTSNPLSVSGEFGADWISAFKAQNPQTSNQNLENDLWSWGGSPKGSTVINGALVPDPYYVWKSLNYSRGWLGQVYTDPNTGYPVYSYIDPYIGMQVYFYMDPNTGRPVYLNGFSPFEYPYYGGAYPYYYSSGYPSSKYALAPVFA